MGRALVVNLIDLIKNRLSRTVKVEMEAEMRLQQHFDPSLWGYGLTTVKILYRLPDHLSLLQTFAWQEYDNCPDFPRLNKFLAFWEKSLEGPLHSILVAHRRILGPNEVRIARAEFKLN
jgi:uncharacterized protein Usg